MNKITINRKINSIYRSISSINDDCFLAPGRPFSGRLLPCAGSPIFGATASLCRVTRFRGGCFDHIDTPCSRAMVSARLWGTQITAASWISHELNLIAGPLDCHVMKGMVRVNSISMNNYLIQVLDSQFCQSNN
jgi:hypothetical protein